MVPYAEYLDVDKLHVQAPSALVLLCGGGLTDIGSTPPVSLRDAFRKISPVRKLGTLDVVLAEDITKIFVFSSFYNDVLEFETDFAQIMDLVVLFCESEGALAELGSFAMIPEIAARLFVVVSNTYWDAESFVKLGPLNHLIKKYGDGSVFVIDDGDIGVSVTVLTQHKISVRDYSKVSPAVLSERIEIPILDRLKKAKDPTTFDPKRSGHVIKLIVGLIQEYGALTLYEIDELLLHFNVYCETSKILGYLLCAVQAEWIIERRKGNEDYYIVRGAKKDAATFRTIEGAPTDARNKTRRRGDILEHWRTNDSNRFRGIQEGRALS